MLPTYNKNNHPDGIVDHVHDITFSAGHGKAETMLSLASSLFCAVLQPVYVL